MYSDADGATAEVLLWAPGDVPSWFVDPEPTLEIAGDAGFARVTKGGLLSDGSFVALDIGLQEVRRYDASTGRVTVVGAKGEGPGEYENPFGVWVGPQDSIYVWDAGLRRASVFAPDGVFARSLNVPPTDMAFPVAAGPLPGGDWLIGFHRGAPDPSPGARRSTSVQWRVTDVTGKPGDVFTVTSGSEMVGIEWQGRASIIPVVFGGTTKAAPLATGIVLVGTSEPGWRLFDRSGRLQRVIQSRVPAVAVTASDRAQFSAYRMKSPPAGADLVAWRQFFDSPIYADSFPRFEGLKVSRDGEIWLEEFRPVWEPIASWWVFSSTGQVLSRVELPQGFTLLAVLGGQLLGVTLDEFDVPVLQILRFTRDSA